MNFSGIPSRSPWGRLLRLPLRLLPRGMTVRVLQGGVRGMRWIVGASTHGCWLGSFEWDKQEHLRTAVEPGKVAFDVGANVGFYTLLLARVLGPEGHVVAFEPVPRNLSFLHRHLALNGVRNVSVIEAAVADREGVATFDEGPDPSMGHLGAGRLRVRTLRLDDALARGEIPVPAYMKIDVEGAEADVLRGAEGILREARPVVFLATHGPAVHAECLEILTGHGYVVTPLGDTGDELTATPA